MKQIKQIESHILEIQNTKSPEPVEIQLSAIKEKLEKFKGVNPKDINRQIVNELLKNYRGTVGGYMCNTNISIEVWKP